MSTHPENIKGNVIEDVVFTDALSDVARKTRRNYMFVSLFAIIVFVYDIKIKKIPWLELDVEGKARGLLASLLVIAVIYYTVVYIFYLLQDIGRWKAGGFIIKTKHMWEKIAVIGNDINSIEQKTSVIEEAYSKKKLSESEQGALTDNWFANEITKIRNMVTGVLKKGPKFKDELEILDTLYLKKMKIQWVRIWIIDIGIPLTLGISSLIVMLVY